MKEESEMNLKKTMKHLRATRPRKEKENAAALAMVVDEMVKHGTMWPKGNPIPFGPFKGEKMP
jgi:hypothetical protein